MKKSRKQSKKTAPKAYQASLPNQNVQHRVEKRSKAANPFEIGTRSVLQGKPLRKG